MGPKGLLTAFLLRELCERQIYDNPSRHVVGLIFIGRDPILNELVTERGIDVKYIIPHGAGLFFKNKLIFHAFGGRDEHTMRVIKRYLR